MCPKLCMGVTFDIQITWTKCLCCRNHAPTVWQALSMMSSSIGMHILTIGFLFGVTLFGCGFACFNQVWFLTCFSIHTLDTWTDLWVPLYLKTDKSKSRLIRTESNNCISHVLNCTLNLKFTSIEGFLLGVVCSDYAGPKCVRKSHWRFQPEPMQCCPSVWKGGGVYTHKTFTKCNSFENSSSPLIVPERIEHRQELNPSVHLQCLKASAQPNNAQWKLFQFDQFCLRGGRRHSSDEYAYSIPHPCATLVP